MNDNTLRIIPLGGTTTVQKNMYVYETNTDMIIVDCGVGFPDIYTPGVDIIIPDFKYILERKNKVKGVVLTHGHDDHRSSIPYLLREYPFPIYSVPFVNALLKAALEEFTNVRTDTLKVFNPDTDIIQLGQFTLHPYRVNHSIPDTLGFAIDTPAGRVFHNTDYKFDWSPVMDKPFDIQKAAILATEPKNGVLALLSDCLGSTTEGYSVTERIILDTFEEILANSIGKQIFITTLSSNISRIHQAIEASLMFGRKVVLSGRSIRQTMKVAREMNYIDYPDEVFVDEKDAHKEDQSLITYIITGSYAQPRSGLVRLALGEHKSIQLQKDAVIIFSADPIPNSVGAVNMIIDELYLRGAEVYYSEIQDNLHVSGHGLRGDQKLLANIVKPKYFIPIGGNVKHMRAYSEMMQEMGIEENRILQLLDGQVVEFENQQAKFGEQLKLKDVYVDGTIVGDVGTMVIEDRIQMANNGMVVVAINNGTINVVTRGFVFVKESRELLKHAESVVKRSLDSRTSRDLPKVHLEKSVARDLSKFFHKETGREPLVIVSIV